MEKITRKEAKEQGLKQYFTGKPCKRGHVSNRLLSTGVCLECSKLRCSQFHYENTEYNKQRRQKWREQNLDKANATNRNWKKNNKNKVNAINSRRRGQKIQRTPKWIADFDIGLWYEVAEVLSRSGIRFHVDHIIPLQGKTVSGFHVENNLQVIPAHENIFKNNRWDWDNQK
jgi:hypothetical protein